MLSGEKGIDSNIFGYSVLILKFTFWKLHGDPQVRVLIFITWYKGEPAWTHALEGPHSATPATQRASLATITQSVNNRNKFWFDHATFHSEVDPMGIRIWRLQKGRRKIWKSGGASID